MLGQRRQLHVCEGERNHLAQPQTRRPPGRRGQHELAGLLGVEAAELLEVADGLITAVLVDSAARILGDGVGRLFS